MSQIKIIEFAGMAGSGKTFLATSLQPYLLAEGLNSTYLVHGPLTGSRRTVLYGKKLFYSFYLFILMPKSIIRVGYAIIQSHPLKLKRLLGIILNVFYKLGFILNKRGIIVLDEGLVHATWSVYLFGYRFPHELYTILSEIMRRRDINLSVIKVVIESSTLHEQFVRRSKVLDWRHDLAPGGQVDWKAFDEAVNKYQEVMRHFRPLIDRTFELSNTSDFNSQDLTNLAKSIVRWSKFTSSEKVE